MTAGRAGELSEHIDDLKKSKHPKAPLWVLVAKMVQAMEAAGVLDTDDDSTRDEKLRAWVAAGRPVRVRNGSEPLAERRR